MLKSHMCAILETIYLLIPEALFPESPMIFCKISRDSGAMQEMKDLETPTCIYAQILHVNSPGLVGGVPTLHGEH